jgi:hypothetical protein
MSNLEKTLGKFRRAWTAKSMRSYWPPHLEPAPDPVDLSAVRPSFGFFLNADDTPRFGAPTLAWPEPVAMIAQRPLPAFRAVANEARTRAA